MDDATQRAVQRMQDIFADGERDRSRMMFEHDLGESLTDDEAALFAVFNREPGSTWTDAELLRAYRIGRDGPPF